MIESGGALGFFEKTLTIGRLRAGSGTLDGYESLKGGIFGDIDLPHAARAQPTDGPPQNRPQACPRGYQRRQEAS
jgi:hypothetical protein